MPELELRHVVRTFYCDVEGGEITIVVGNSWKFATVGLGEVLGIVVLTNNQQTHNRTVRIHSMEDGAEVTNLAQYLGTVGLEVGLRHVFVEYVGVEGY